MLPAQTQAGGPVRPSLPLRSLSPLQPAQCPGGGVPRAWVSAPNARAGDSGKGGCAFGSR